MHEYLPGKLHQFASDYLAETSRLLSSLLVEDIATLAAILQDAYVRERQIFVAGNGGSAATASHFANDLVKATFSSSNKPRSGRFRVLSLADPVPLLTALANDVGYDQAFAEQLKAHAMPGDVAVFISVSGRSPNIVRAAQVARELDLRCIGFLGCDGGLVQPLLEHHLLVMSTSYAHVEDVHHVACHLLASYFGEAIAVGALQEERATFTAEGVA